MVSTSVAFLAVILFAWGCTEAMEPNRWIPNIAEETENLPSIKPKKFKDGGNLQPVPKANSGLECGTHTIEVGETITIKSKNYPSNFPRNENCKWKFMSPSGSRISLKCQVFQLKKCKQTSLKVTGGDFSETFCNKNDGLSASSTTNSMKIVFKSKKKTDKGFTCKVSASVAPTTPEPTTRLPPFPVCKCGHVNRAIRIVGGNTTEVHEYPWQVAITDRYSKQPYCGGSIVSNQWILTSAQCMKEENPSNNRIVIGEHNWNSDSETSRTERRKISQIVIHPNYNNQNMDNNLALVKLKSPIKFKANNKIAPVCLPHSGNLFENVDATITGWGTLSSGGSQPNKLHDVTLPTMSNNQCKSYLDNLASYITKNMICAGTGHGGKDFCSGDYGGPLVTAGNPGQTFMIQIGIASWSVDCGDPKPGVYTRVSNYVDWISKTTTGSSSCPAY